MLPYTRGQKSLDTKRRIYNGTLLQVHDFKSADNQGYNNVLAVDDHQNVIMLVNPV